ncbi:MAG TPA: enolase C-terminal domain-like protein [Opitutaceae bacterium]|nr:enolase C-terminal domain-like protein [Opitutaceae bacterium]
MRFAIAERGAPSVQRVRVGAFEIPTPAPESDGTLTWRKTTLVVTEIAAGDVTGLGYTYADAATARVIRDHLQPVIEGRNSAETERLWHEMFAQVRNLGTEGIAAMAISAVDVALWDAKARHHGVALVDLLGRARDKLPVYGSGGFCSYTEPQLRDEFVGWYRQGIRRFKMKVGRDPRNDPARVGVARSTIGPNAELFVDANSAYSRKEAADWADRYAKEFGVVWFEQPLDPSDLAGLRELRERAPAPLEIADGEYGYGLAYFRRLLEAQAIDVVQADATRCGGITGFMKVAALCEAWSLPLSSHCAPALHLHPGCAAGPMRHAEFFADHERIERELFDGVASPEGGVLHPDASRPGLGLEFKWKDAERYAI